MTKLKRYEYPIKVGDKVICIGSYTIKEDIKPLGFKNEKLVQEFEAEVK